MKKYEVGDIKNGFPVLPITKRKKLLWLSDDARTHSGVGTVSREVIWGILHQYNIVQVGGAANHPEAGKIADMSEILRSEVGLEDIYFRIYATNGYGDQDLIRHLIKEEEPDAILHFTDPRFWVWLYQMEHEIRQKMPIIYYNIWDDLPLPHYNKNFYKSCDMLLGISKQTYNINRTVLENDNYKDWQIKYVPHGINDITMYPMRDKMSISRKRLELLGTDEYEFVIMYNSRNIRRKMTSDIILAFKTFLDKLPEDKRKKCALVLHTDAIDENGTNLPEVIRILAPDANIIIHQQKLGPWDMHYLYNIADVTINLSSNEGFGLSTAESLMCGTPIIVNVTGGLQDQCGFKDDNGRLLTEDDYTADFPSNHNGRYKNCGEWVYPVFPATRSIQGSVPTPYIFDDRANWEDAAEAMLYWYEMPYEQRIQCGDAGREYVMNPKVGMSAPEMCHRFIENINICMDKFEPRKKFTLFDMNNYKTTVDHVGILPTVK